jgi:mannose-1-phosphate guanylyltransferase
VWRVRGVILVGGEGTRLRPLTWRRPKAMAPILGRPFLEHMLVFLRGQGVDEILLALGHQPDAIQRYFGDGGRWGVRLSMAVEPQPLGSGGAIRQFRERLTEPFFAFNGDILTNVPLAPMVARHRETAAAVSIFFIAVDDPSMFGVARLDGDERVLEFVEKPPAGSAPSNWANAGVWLFQPEVLARVPEGRRSMVETELFPELIAAGERVQAFCRQCFWVDIGTPVRYLDAQLRLLAEPELRVLPLRSWPGLSDPAALSSADDPLTVPPPTIAPGVELRGPVLLGSGVQVAAGARLLGPLAIGDGCQIKASARLERAVLWENCTIGAAARISGSVLADGCRIGPGAELDGVVVGQAASVAAGVRLVGRAIAPDEAVM